MDEFKFLGSNIQSNGQRGEEEGAGRVEQVEMRVRGTCGSRTATRVKEKVYMTLVRPALTVWRRPSWRWQRLFTGSEQEHRIS